MAKFTDEGWARIKDFNKNAADPSKPEVKYTFENREIASRAGSHPRLPHSPQVRASISLGTHIHHMGKKIARGEIPSNSKIELIIKRIRSGVIISATVQALLDSMLADLDDLEDPRDKLVGKKEIARIYLEVLKMHHRSEETITKKLPLSQLQELLNQNRKPDERTE